MGRIRTTGNGRTRTRLADLPAVAAFNPVTDIGWAHLYYAGGPAFAAVAPSDGSSFSAINWPDEIAANAADLNAGAGTYRAASANMNSKPSIEAGTSGKRHSTTVAGGAQVAAPYSIVSITYINSTFSPPKYFYDGPNEGSTGNRIILIVNTGPTWTVYAGTANQSGGTVSAGIHAARLYITSGNDVLTVNGSTVISGVNTGGATWQGMSWTETGVVPVGFLSAFYGLYSGDITAAGNWSAFQSWVLSTYGVSIS